MQLIFLDLLAAEELVDYVLGHVQALRLKAELAMHVYDPFQEEGTRGVTDLCLDLGYVLWVNHEFKLLLFHVLKVLLRVLSDGLWVSNLLPIDQWHFHHFRLQVVLDSLIMQFFYPLCMCLRWTFIIYLLTRNCGFHHFIAA